MRLTYKNHKIEIAKNRKIFEKDVDLICEKLGQLEDILENHNIETLEQLDVLLSYVKQIKDIEKEFGIDLITYIKIMQDGFYGMCEDEDHKEPYVFFFEPQDIELDTESKELIVWWECTAHDCNEENVYTKYKIKDQGKTWALTKEGLENE